MEAAVEGEGKKPTLQGEHWPLVAEGMDGSCSAGVWTRKEAHMRWDAARGEPRQEKGRQVKILGRTCWHVGQMGGKQGAHRAGVWEPARGEQGGRKLLAGQCLSF